MKADYCQAKFIKELSLVISHMSLRWAFGDPWKTFSPFIDGFIGLFTVALKAYLQWHLQDYLQCTPLYFPMTGLSRTNSFDKFHFFQPFNISPNRSPISFNNFSQLIISYFWIIFYIFDNFLFLFFAWPLFSIPLLRVCCPAIFYRIIEDIFLPLPGSILHRVPNHRDLIGAFTVARQIYPIPQTNVKSLCLRIFYK